jgi:hypothetical protein
MSRAIQKLSLLLVSLLSIFYSFPPLVRADACRDLKTSGDQKINYSTTPVAPIPEGLGEVKITFSNVGAGYYRLRFGGEGDALLIGSKINIYTAAVPANPDGTVTLVINENNEGMVGNNIPAGKQGKQLLAQGSHSGTLEYSSDGTDANLQTDYCGDVSYVIGSNKGNCSMSFNPTKPQTNGQFMAIVSNAPSGTYNLRIKENAIGPRFDKSLSDISIDSTGRGVSEPIQGSRLGSPRRDIELYIDFSKSIGYTQGCNTKVELLAGTTTPSPSCEILPPSGHSYSVRAINLTDGTIYSSNLSKDGNSPKQPQKNTPAGAARSLDLSLGMIKADGSEDGAYSGSVSDPNGDICSFSFTISKGNIVPGTTSTSKVCSPTDKSCTHSAVTYCPPKFGKSTSGIPTAIGCIPTDPISLVQTVIQFVLAIAGGMAFLLMIMGAFGMITSAGNPEGINAGKDRFTKAVEGLLFVIFAVLLMKIIGVDILGLDAVLGF